MIFASLKHPIRRKILRILSSEPQTFSDLQKQFNIESSHLTYHIDGLGNLLYKTENGKYALSSLGDAAVSMMKNVEEPSPTLHFSFTRRSRGIGKKIAGRVVAIALGIICIVLAAALVGAFAYYVPLTNEKDNTIHFLNTQISQLESNITDLQSQLASDNSTINSLISNLTRLQNQLSWFLTPTISIERIVSGPSEFVNKTVVVEGKLFGPLVYFTSISWGYELSTNGTEMPQTNLGPNAIGVDLGLRGRVYSGEDVVLTGVVQKGFIGTIVSGESPTVSYYIEAEFVILK
jgi:hypothetical protein